LPKFAAQHRNVGLWFESPSDLDRSTWMSGLNRQTVCGKRHKPSKQKEEALRMLAGASPCQP
jgi:hypothetical protein